MRSVAGPLGRKTARILKFLWYLCASILILSLPTFSFLVPRHDSAPLGDRAPESTWKSERGGSAARTSRSSPSNVFSTVDAGARPGAASTASRDRQRPGADRFARGRVEPQQGAVVSAEEFIPPQRFEQRRAAGRVPVRDEQPEAAHVNSALAEVQEGYEQAFTNLFPDVFFGVPASSNPFQRALDDNSPPGDSNPPGDDGPDPGQSDEAGGGDQGGESSSPEPGPPAPDEPAPPEPGNNGGSGEGPPARNEPEYGFLILGQIPGNPGGSLISRANLDVSGHFVLENSYQFSFFTGVLHSLLTFGEHESVLIADLDQNGLNDFIVATEAAAVGTGVESYLQTSPGHFELHATTLLYLQAIQSMALFDFDGDGTQELALALHGQPHLFVYRRTGSEWVYLMELALPVQPALLMTSAAAGPRNRTLYVVDDNLQYVVSATERRPDLFRFGSTAPLNRLSRLAVNWTGRAGGESEVLAFGFADQIVLAERRRGLLRTFVSMDAEGKAPLMIIGDFAGIGSRQIVWVP